jgi:RNA polymerase nonessential primary-like sigma factor
MTLAKIGDRLNISRERVRQIEREALTKLRKRKQNVQEYLAS